jgi:hypothetical protein
MLFLFPHDDFIEAGGLNEKYFSLGVVDGAGASLVLLYCLRTSRQRRTHG